MSETDGKDDSSGYLAAPAVGAPDAWTAATAGRHGTQQLLHVGEVDPSGKIARALEIPDGERAVVRRRLMLLDGRPVEIAESFYPLPVAVGTPLAGARKIKGGAPAAFAALGLAVAYADEEVELDCAPTAEEAGLLRVSVETRVVRLFRTAYTAADLPFEVTVSVMLPAGRTLRHRLIVG